MALDPFSSGSAVFKIRNKYVLYALYEFSISHLIVWINNFPDLIKYDFVSVWYQLIHSFNYLAFPRINAITGSISCGTRPVATRTLRQIP